jgi:hypothetical protein
MSASPRGVRGSIGAAGVLTSRRPAFNVALAGAMAMMAFTGVPRAADPQPADSSPADPSLVGSYASATVTPGTVKLGERTLYRGRALYRFTGPVQWLPPEPDPTFTWGKLTARVLHPETGQRVGNAARPPNRLASDTLVVEAPLQVFKTGVITIPGLRLRAKNSTAPNNYLYYRLPAVNLMVVSVLTPADSNARLRPARGPIRAPWWERISWIKVGLAALVLAALVAAVLLWRRRKKRELPAPVPVRLDPAGEALQELAALRRLNLPAQGRFAEHAFHLSQIARRFLEATAGTARPGDCTPELIAHLETAQLGREHVDRLSGLLRWWDRIKFARAPASIEEATRAEESVEALVRHPAPEPDKKVA